ncbi:hypothetical protein [Streptomyces sp. AF1A]|jgi:hypothetical protein|uniref:hypothetical protein n=1 Tax=Streptomyces sp. AF1A TaxID=3394350 RepID=UPI0039BCD835
MASVISLYFLHNGDLTPYPRKIADPGEASAVVRLLFGGPSKSEAATATTDLPRLTGVPKVEIGSDNTFIVQLPDDVSPLSRVAMRQLACTVAHVALPFAALPTDTIADGAPSAPAQPQRSRSVRVLGNGWTMAQSDDACPAPFRP